MTLAAVRKFYFDHHASKIRSTATAKRAWSLLAQYMRSVGLEGAPRVADFGLARQHAFMKWCRQKDLSCKSIATYLDYIKAGLKFAAAPRIVVDKSGEEREVQLLRIAPSVASGEGVVSQVTGAPRSQPRAWIPTDAELAAIIDAIEHEHVFRYVIMALNTWARPEAILDLSVQQQVNFEQGLLDLNPPGRPQNKKVRPLIRLTNNLRGWLLHWNLDYPIALANGRRVAHIDNRTLVKAAKRAGVDGPMNRYVLRHYMATRIRRVDGVPVPREERAAWMGHVDPEFRTTEHWYESMDPDYLLAPMQATDAIMTRLGTMMKREMSAPGVHQSGLMVVSNPVEPSRKVDAS